jgi:hypothetical protein
MCALSKQILYVILLEPHVIASIGIYLINVGSRSLSIFFYYYFFFFHGFVGSEE